MVNGSNHILPAWAPRVGLERSKVAIQFRDINYEAEVLIGSSGLPSVSNSFKNLALVPANPSELTTCQKGRPQLQYIHLPCMVAIIRLLACQGGFGMLSHLAAR